MVTLKTIARIVVIIKIIAMIVVEQNEFKE